MRPPHTLDDSQIDDLLAQVTVDHDPGPKFERRVVREFTLFKHTRTLKFWTPVLVGAGIASFALLAVIEMVMSAPVRRDQPLTGQEAKVERSGSLPEFLDPGTNRLVK